MSQFDLILGGVNSLLAHPEAILFSMIGVWLGIWWARYRA